MKKIIWRELLDRKWSLFWYCFAALALLWVYAATFKQSQASAQQLVDVVKAYPKALIEAFGLNNLTSNSIEQYLNGKHFSFLWPLMAILLALPRAGSQLAGEIQEHTMGLLLSMPVRRLAIFAAKYISGLIAILIFTIVSIFPIMPLASIYGIETHPRVLVAAWMLITLFTWSVYSLAMLAASLVSHAGKVYSAVATFLLVSYVANILALISDKASWLKHYSVFYYFDTAGVLTSGHIRLATILVFSATIVVATVLAAWRFDQRDIHV